MARSSTALSPRDVYQTVTDRIVAAIEANPAKPEMPWHRSGLATFIPLNAHTENKYRGINVVSLWAEAQIRDFPYAVWASYKQWQGLGAQVRKGEKAANVVFYKEFKVDADPEREDDDGKRFVAKMSSVFNAAQVDGYTPADAPPPLPPLQRIARAETFFKATGASIVIGGDQAFYRPATDQIHMPDEDRFGAEDPHTRTEDWYRVLGHESAHWSGAEKRLNRTFGKRFGDQAYCVEELVGELTSAFVMASLGISPQPRADHAHYLSQYLKLMKADKSAIFAAAAKAAQAADYLAAFSVAPEPDQPAPGDEAER
jgi:antirestriction protein ArdC